MLHHSSAGCSAEIDMSLVNEAGPRGAFSVQRSSVQAHWTDSVMATIAPIHRKGLKVASVPISKSSGFLI